MISITAPDKDHQYKEEPDKEAQITSPDKGHVYKDIVDEEAQRTGSDKSYLYEEEQDEEAQEMAEEYIGWLRRYIHFHQQRDLEACDDLAGLVQHSRSFFANYIPRIKVCTCVYIPIN